MKETEQIILRWPGPFYPDQLRKRFAASATALGYTEDEIGWLFHRHGGKQQDGPALNRFIGGKDMVGISAVGEEACINLDGNLRKVLAIAKQAGLDTQPDLRTGKLSYARIPFSEPYSIYQIAMQKIRIGEGIADPAPEEVVRRVKITVANSVAALSEAAGLDRIDISPDDISVLSVAEHKLAPLHTNAGGKTGYMPFWPRIDVALPFKLQGEWAAGSLVARGFGRIKRHAQIRHARGTRAGRSTPANSYEGEMA